MDVVEALGELSPLLRQHRFPLGGSASPQLLALGALGRGYGLVQDLDSLVAGGGSLDLTGEHDRRRRRAANHRGAGAFERDCLEAMD